MLLSEKQQIGDDFSCNFLNILHNNGSSASKLDVAVSIMEENFGHPYKIHRGRNIYFIPGILFSQWYGHFFFLHNYVIDAKY
jgi:hypothetical protein